MVKETKLWLRSCSNLSDRHIWRQLRFGQFCTFKITYSHESVSFSCLLYAQSLSAHHQSTQVTATNDDNRVLNGSAHLKSHTLMRQSASVVCCTLSISLSLSLHANTSDWHIWRRQSFGWFCAFKAMCPCEPVNFSHFLYTLCLSLHATHHHSCQSVLMLGNFNTKSQNKVSLFSRIMFHPYKL
jgi:hypothetical protein